MVMMMVAMAVCGSVFVLAVVLGFMVPLFLCTCVHSTYLQDKLSIERSYCTSTRDSYIGVVIFYLYVPNDTSTGPDLGINTIPEVVGNNHQNRLNQDNNQFSLCHI